MFMVIQNALIFFDGVLWIGERKFAGLFFLNIQFSDMFSMGLFQNIITFLHEIGFFH
jgi:hypothetical protein